MGSHGRSSAGRAGARARAGAPGAAPKATAPDGTLRSPMRAAEAHTTVAVAAARDGDLDGAVEAGTAAIEIPRQSVPSLLMVADDLVTELRERFPGEPQAGDYLGRLRDLASG
jgi:hypothetical protein